MSHDPPCSLEKSKINWTKKFYFIFLWNPWGINPWKCLLARGIGWEESLAPPLEVFTFNKFSWWEGSSMASFLNDEILKEATAASTVGASLCLISFLSYSFASLSSQRYCLTSTKSCLCFLAISIFWSRLFITLQIKSSLRFFLATTLPRSLFRK